MADAAALGVRSALVVSQRYHLPRALYLARHAGIDAVGVPAQDTHEGWASLAKLFVREAAARAETVVEVALRGVR
jgi:SanA protein